MTELAHPIRLALLEILLRAKEDAQAYAQYNRLRKKGLNPQYIQDIAIPGVHKKGSKKQLEDHCASRRMWWRFQKSSAYPKDGNVNSEAIIQWVWDDITTPAYRRGKQ